MINEELIIKYLQENLSSKRYIHSINVSDTAVKLAILYGVDIERAKIAGLVHDCAREASKDQLIKYMEASGIQPDAVSLCQKELLHGPAGVYVCRSIFLIEDEEILSAVRYHTTGKERMSILEKVIFIADFIEPCREFPGVEKLRELAFEDIDEALIWAYDSTISYIIQKKVMIHPDTISARNYLIRNFKIGDEV